MKYPDFRRLVLRMRDFQKAYFDRRDPRDLVRAKRLECQVDRELRAGGDLFNRLGDDREATLPIFECTRLGCGFSFAGFAENAAGPPVATCSKCGSRAEPIE